MKYHPSFQMICVWLSCIAAFWILPFQLETRIFSLYGAIILSIFIGTFCVGGLLAARPGSKPLRRTISLPDFKMADKIFVVVAGIATVALLIEFGTSNFLNLDESFASRSSRAQALLAGSQSESSITFQIAFVLYPLSFSYLVREIGFEKHPRIYRLIALGFLPIILAALVMGGRGPVLISMFVIILSFRLRQFVFQTVHDKKLKKKRTSKFYVNLIVIVVAVLVAMNYFVDVFLVRANMAGGSGQMLQSVATIWGVSFDGFLSPYFRAILGEGNTYLLFVFVWYLVQGLVMSNILFTEYDGPPHLGVYGIDLASAVMRRIDGQFVSDRFYQLLDLNTYGFLPSAFGSLYVDLKWLGLLVCLIWGYIAGMVYRNANRSSNGRWLFVAPFISLGIFFSLINTPLGFGNGLMVLFWMMVVVFVSKPRKMHQAVRRSHSSISPSGGATAGAR
jgi:hypothetical protein